jgi:16S rRNA (uracil1498-N3)-methyltransferase
VSLPRFYAPELEWSVREAVLPADEAHHLTRVMRLGIGDDIAVFDGRGREFRARVLSAGRGRVRIELLEAIAPAPEARVPLTLVQAVLKGDKMDAVVRDATMLGVSAIQPVITSRTIARPPRRENDRWVRVAVSSAKQCRRAVVPSIAAPRLFDDWLDASAHGLRLILVEPSAADRGVCSLRVLEDHAPASLALIAGPEGGWNEDEREHADRSRCIAGTLGGLTLRAYAVAVAAIAIARFALKDS